MIRVERLGKRYRISGPRERHQTLRETLVHLGTAPFRGFYRTLAGRRSAAGAEEIVWALKEVSFQVERGEVVGIIGRNGVGKTTLLKILSRITRPTEGRAEIHDRIGSLLEVGTGFHPELTGRENIFLNGAILGMKRAEINRRFSEIVDFAGIGKFIDTPVKHYSSGMHLRLAFAVAAHLEPDVLLVDEVLAVGDGDFQEKCLKKMGHLNREGRTVLFVSHNMMAVKALCGRAILLQGGRLVADGHPSRIVRTYLASGRVSKAEAVWDDREQGPGNELFRLRSVRVRSADGKMTSEIGSEQPFDIEIEYWNLHDGAKLGATIVLYNENGLCVFGSLSNHERHWHGRRRPEGLYRSTCRVPGALLPDGRFSVSVLLWVDGYTSLYREDSVVEFEIHESREVRGDYFGDMDGVIRPLLEWNTELVTLSSDMATYSRECRQNNGDVERR